MDKCDEKFITDINELCDRCDIPKKVAEVRANMIRKCEAVKELNNAEYYFNHLKEKITEANAKIENILNAEANGGDTYRSNRVKLFLIWKDCLQYYNEQLEQMKNEVESNAKKERQKSVLEEALEAVKANQKIAEQKAKQQEKESFERSIDSTKNYCNTVARFQQWLKIDKATLSQKDFLTKLREQQIQYGNALVHYIQYEQSGRLANTYEKIKDIIDTEINAALEVLEHSDIKKKKSTNTKPVHFNYSNKENYFYPDKIESFKQIEKDMTENEYLKNGCWNTEKTKLVAFIHFLKQLNYLRPKIKGKTEKASLLLYRRYFENRYKTEISEQMKPSKFIIEKLHLFTPYFMFIPEKNNL